MNVENNLTADKHTKDGSETITIHTSLGDDDEDVHKCGRCQSEFSTLEAFIQHKLHHSSRREPSSQDEEQMVETANGGTQAVQEDASEPESTNINDTGASAAALGRGCRKKSTSQKLSRQSETPKGPVSNNAEGDKPVYKVNVDGRYLCHLCDKTFKTSNILKTHMKTHSDQKNFACELCGNCFRTKGSLIRHSRRHSDERPYHCVLCGQSFRESGALTRHLKSLTPCTEKIRFVQCKEILVSKDGRKKGLGADVPAETGQRELVVVKGQPAEEQVVETQTAVVNLVEAGSQEVLHQVHFTMEVDGTTQEQQVMVDQSQAEALAAAAGDNLICQAILNSGIALRTEEAAQAPQATHEELEKMVIECPLADGTEIQVKEELVEVVAPERDQTASKLYTCPHCNRSFKGLNYFRFHVKGHSGFKPFRCTLCQRDFLSGYLLKKHMDVHVSERRYKCGECGKLYKTVGHVREHMRAHSDERPYHCARCKKAYKTKNALQVHQRTHGEVKPYVCKFCFRGFREKGSLVRHTRHHTGEKPFKCPKCGRGFAEHGTLNRHIRAKGGCHKDESSKQQQQVEEEEVVTEELLPGDNVTTAAIITEDPHALLVEFSSVVADTQEYIIKPQTDEEIHEEGETLIQDSQNEMGDHIVKVVQQIVSQSHDAGGTASHQIILRNVSGGEEGASIMDCGDTITIATPESLTEQVAMALASAISDGTLLVQSVKTAQGAVALVTTEEVVEERIHLQDEEGYVITTPQEVEIQTVIV